jgi:hypothetical protein
MSNTHIEAVKPDCKYGFGLEEAQRGCARKLPRSMKQVWYSDFRGGQLRHSALLPHPLIIGRGARLDSISMLLDLPVEILSEVLIHLDHLSILRCSAVIFISLHHPL